jgi:hypothetical protein
MNDKDLITEYLHALSGREKNPELVGKYVTDPKLAAHIAEVEAAFPAYELIAEDVLSERDKVVVRATFRGYTWVRSQVLNRRANKLRRG